MHETAARVCHGVKDRSCLTTGAIAPHVTRLPGVNRLPGRARRPISREGGRLVVYEVLQKRRGKGGVMVGWVMFGVTMDDAHHPPTHP